MKTKMFLLVSLFLSQLVLAEEFAVIVNSGNETGTVSKAQLKRIFLGQIKELNGVQLVPINLPPDSDLGNQFLTDVTGKSGEEYKEYWVAQQVKGLGSAPMIQKTSMIVKTMVAQIPGAIAYIPKADVDGTVKELTVK